MNICEMMKSLFQSAKSIILLTAWVATASAQMANDVRFPLGYIRVLVKPVFGLGILVTKTFRTQGWADKIMAELGKVTFQRQRTKVSVRPQMLGGVTLPGLPVVEPLEA